MKITEEMHVHDQWYKDAKEMKADKLPEFIRHLSEDYEHDYGTICHAIAAAAIAAAWTIERSPQGGITGFQASAIMWEFMKHWNNVEAPARLLDYKDLLYPQMEYKFKSISKETWDSIQEIAKKNLAEKDRMVHPDVHAHWQSIAAGKIPFGLQLEVERN